MKDYPEWVLGDFHEDIRLQEDPSWAGYTVAKDYGNGVVLLRKKNR